MFLECFSRARPTFNKTWISSTVKRVGVRLYVTAARWKLSSLIGGILFAQFLSRLLLHLVFLRFFRWCLRKCMENETKQLAAVNISKRRSFTRSTTFLQCCLVDPFISCVLVSFDQRDGRIFQLLVQLINYITLSTLWVSFLNWISTLSTSLGSLQCNCECGWASDFWYDCCAVQRNVSAEKTLPAAPE